MLLEGVASVDATELGEGVAAFVAADMEGVDDGDVAYDADGEAVAERDGNGARAYTLPTMSTTISVPSAASAGGAKKATPAGFTNGVHELEVVALLIPYTEPAPPPLPTEAA